MPSEMQKITSSSFENGNQRLFIVINGHVNCNQVQLKLKWLYVGLYGSSMGIIRNFPAVSWPERPELEPREQRADLDSDKELKS